jgi:hypothetical protein
MRFILKYITIPLACLLCLSFSSCEKEEVLPAETTTGEGTFGCYVNGKLWVPKGKLLDDIMDLSYDPNYQGGWLNLYSHNRNDGITETIRLASYKVSQPDLYEVNLDSEMMIIYNDDKSCKYTQDQATYYEGFVHIKKLDLESRIIAGTFELTAKIPDCDTLRITQGRFDMKI